MTLERPVMSGPLERPVMPAQWDQLAILACLAMWVQWDLLAPRALKAQWAAKGCKDLLGALVP